MKIIKHATQSERVNLLLYDGIEFDVTPIDDKIMFSHPAYRTIMSQNEIISIVNHLSTKNKIVIIDVKGDQLNNMLISFINRVYKLNKENTFVTSRYTNVLSFFSEHNINTILHIEFVTNYDILNCIIEKIGATNISFPDWIFNKYDEETLQEINVKKIFVVGKNVGKYKSDYVYGILV